MWHNGILFNNKNNELSTLATTLINLQYIMPRGKKSQKATFFFKILFICLFERGKERESQAVSALSEHGARQGAPSHNPEIMN